MPLTFNMLLREAGIAPGDVRLIRYKGYDLWSADPARFREYQTYDEVDRRTALSAKYWAVFLILPKCEGLFVSLDRVERVDLISESFVHPLTSETIEQNTRDRYRLTPVDGFQDLVGKLIIDWGSGTRARIQHADKQEKYVLELRREVAVNPFPGFLEFGCTIAEIEALPVEWVDALRSACGVYLIADPATGECYVGSASGVDGFWRRWQDYARSGHGGNIALKDRSMSDYKIAILEVAGSAATEDQIIQRESLWKEKLGTRVSGLNLN